MIHKSTVLRTYQTGNGWVVIYKIAGKEHFATADCELSEGQSITVIDGVVQ